MLTNKDLTRAMIRFMDSGPVMGKAAADYMHNMGKKAFEKRQEEERREWAAFEKSLKNKPSDDHNG